MLEPAKIATRPVPTGVTGNVLGTTTTVAKSIPSGRLKIGRQTPKFQLTVLLDLLPRDLLAMPQNLVPHQVRMILRAEHLLLCDFRRCILWGPLCRHMQRVSQHEEELVQWGLRMEERLCLYLQNERWYCQRGSCRRQQAQA